MARRRLRKTLPGRQLPRVPLFSLACPRKHHCFHQGLPDRTVPAPAPRSLRAACLWTLPTRGTRASRGDAAASTHVSHVLRGPLGARRPCVHPEGECVPAAGGPAARTVQAVGWMAAVGAPARAAAGRPPQGASGRQRRAAWRTIPLALLLPAEDCPGRHPHQVRAPRALQPGRQVLQGAHHLQEEVQHPAHAAGSH